MRGQARCLHLGECGGVAVAEQARAELQLGFLALHSARTRRNPLAAGWPRPLGCSQPPSRATQAPLFCCLAVLLVPWHPVDPDREQECVSAQPLHPPGRPSRLGQPPPPQLLPPLPRPREAPRQCRSQSRWGSRRRRCRSRRCRCQATPGCDLPRSGCHPWREKREVYQSGFPHISSPPLAASCGSLGLTGLQATARTGVVEHTSCVSPAGQVFIILNFLVAVPSPLL